MSETIHDIFTRVAPRYDTVNTVLSLGIHHLWRRATVDKSGVERGDAVLDCASGTGDLAIAFANQVGPLGRVVASDFNRVMMAHGQEKTEGKNLPVDLEWHVEDVTQMSYPDDHFDAASIAFGIRNVDDPIAGLSEMARVVRPGGSVVVLEFGQPSGLIGPLYDLYNRTVVPFVGGLLTGQRDAYDYLHESSSEFPCGDEFVAMMESTDRFDAVEHHAFTGGIAHFYRGVVAPH